MKKMILLQLLLEIELIETLWNVNDIAGMQNQITEARINRNIVECK